MLKQIYHNQHTPNHPILFTNVLCVFIELREFAGSLAPMKRNQRPSMRPNTIPKLHDQSIVLIHQSAVVFVDWVEGICWLLAAILLPTSSQWEFQVDIVFHCLLIYSSYEMLLNLLRVLLRTRMSCVGSPYSIFLVPYP